jgi:hypothetical protein
LSYPSASQPTHAKNFDAWALAALDCVANAGDGCLVHLLGVHRQAIRRVKSSGTVLAVEVHFALVRLQHLLVIEVAVTVVAPRPREELLERLSLALPWPRHDGGVA